MDNLREVSRKEWKTYESWKWRDGSGQKIVGAEEWASLLKKGKFIRGIIEPGNNSVSKYVSK
jgi:hypothetical protein